MFATGVSLAYIDTYEITNTKGSTDADTRYSATGHLERAIKAQRSNHCYDFSGIHNRH